MYFQSPPTGSCLGNLALRWISPDHNCPFSPLPWGRASATFHLAGAWPWLYLFQSPPPGSRLGNACVASQPRSSSSFQSPPTGSRLGNHRPRDVFQEHHGLSVPSHEVAPLRLRQRHAIPALSYNLSVPASRGAPRQLATPAARLLSSFSPHKSGRASATCASSSMSMHASTFSPLPRGRALATLATVRDLWNNKPLSVPFHWVAPRQHVGRFMVG